MHDCFSLSTEANKPFFVNIVNEFSIVKSKMFLSFHFTAMFEDILLLFRDKEEEERRNGERAMWKM